jgi:hypothetical protein
MQSCLIVVTSLLLTDMKTIYSMGKGKYIQLDSYGEYHGTRRWSVGIALFSVIIAAITISALVGVDVTQINSQYPQEQTNEAQ